MLTDHYPLFVATENLWPDTAPAEHGVQICASDEALVDALEGFVSGGLRAGEGVIVIATTDHRAALETRLRARGFNLDIARAEDRYVPVDAQAALARLMVRGWPDEARFQQLIGDLVRTARGPGRPVRAFGEMVALLWRQGQAGATVRLETLWNEYLERETFRLFCAYAQSDFPETAHAALADICSHHTRRIAAGG